MIFDFLIGVVCAFGAFFLGMVIGHTHAIDERDKLREKLAVAVEALERLLKFTRPEGFIKRTIEEAISKIRGGKC